MKLINLTNDPSINIYLPDGSVVCYPQKGCLRVNSDSIVVDAISSEMILGRIHKIPVMTTVWIPQELPPVIEDTMYIVSSLTAMAIRETHPERKDFICPNTHPSQVVRHGKRVMGCLSFQRMWDVQERVEGYGIDGDIRVAYKREG
jgi:hypothetical protein